MLEGILIFFLIVVIVIGIIHIATYKHFDYDFGKISPWRNQND